MSSDTITVDLDHRTGRMRRLIRGLRGADELIEAIRRQQLQR